MDKAQSKNKILIYTREPKEEYTESLSNSIHFAYSDDMGSFQPLNQNYGMLFALATVNEQNVIQEKGLKNPCLFRTKEGSFGMIAVRVDKEGGDDKESKGNILLWTSDDLIDFQSHGFVRLHEDCVVSEAVCSYNPEEEVYEFYWEDKEGRAYRNTMQELTATYSISSPVVTEKQRKEQVTVNLQGICPGNILPIDQSELDVLIKRWVPIYHTQIHVPEQVTISAKEQLDQIKATAVYSDGSTAEKQVQWNSGEINFSRPGTYTVKGRVMPKEYPFPLASGYADPVILPWNDRYYYIATNDNVDDIGMFVREGNTISELFRPGFKESIILDVDEEKGFIQTFWAPEFHVIGSDLYILFAVGGKVWGPQCHIMKLKRGGNIMEAGDWEEPIRVRRADGSYLTQEGITLDMTYFKANETSCVVWSYRENIGTPLDSGSMLYIATVNEADPSVLTSEPVLLTRPLYGWENIQGTINNEGPYPLVTEDMVYITYSGGAAGGYTYALGLLSIPCSGDFLDAQEWRKAGTPVLSYYSLEGVYGPGHNSFFRDYDGNIMIMYHGEVRIAAKDTRCTGMHRLHFTAEGKPVFNLSKERDQNRMLTEVSLMVKIK